MVPVSVARWTNKPSISDWDLLHHADEIRQGAHPQFRHRPFAMNFDGFFRPTQIAGNLLVAQPCDDLREDLPLARGQSFDFRLNRFQVGEALTVLSLTVFGALYGFEQVSVLYGLR